MADTGDLTGVQRAAIFVMNLPNEDASEVLKHLGPKQVQKLGIAMAALKNVEKEQLDGNASAEPIEGPEVGVAKFGQGTKHHSGEQDLDHGSGTRKTVTQKQPGHPLSLEHQG